MIGRSAVARNYAEALFELGSREDAAERYGDLLAGLAALYREEPRLRRFLEVPGIPLEEKKAVLRRAVDREAPEPFLRFLLVMLEKRRHRALPEIHEAYTDLLDLRANRVHASVSLAFEPDEALRNEIVEALERALEKEVVPHFRSDPDLLGGIRVRVEDRVMDGSLRRRLEDLRRELVRSGTAGP